MSRISCVRTAFLSSLLSVTKKPFVFVGASGAGSTNENQKKAENKGTHRGYYGTLQETLFFLFDISNVQYTRDETTKISLLIVIILYVQERMLYSSLYLAVKPRNIYNNNGKWNVQSIFIGSHASTHQSTECLKSREKKKHCKRIRNAASTEIINNAIVSLVLFQTSHHAVSTYPWNGPPFCGRYPLVPWRAAPFQPEEK